MARRPLTHAEALDSWRVHGELSGGHRPSETIGFVSALQDIADAQQDRWRSLPPGFVSPDCEPRLVTRLRRMFGR
jgi:hypothetical protein